MSRKSLHFNWKLALMRVLVNGAAIFLVALILPGVIIPNPSLLNFVILGAVFGLLNAFVKPIIQFLTLSLIFATYGLVVIFINAIMLWFLSLLFSQILIVNGILTALLGGLLLGILSIVLEGLLGMTEPIYDDSALITEEAG